MAKRVKILLDLDADDARAVRQALRFRRKHAMPDGTSNPQGALIAEICRGWLDMLGKWKWPLATGKPSREAKPVRPLRVVKAE